MHPGSRCNICDCSSRQPSQTFSHGYTYEKNKYTSQPYPYYQSCYGVTPLRIPSHYPYVGKQRRSYICDDSRNYISSPYHQGYNLTPYSSVYRHEYLKSRKIRVEEDTEIEYFTSFELDRSDKKKKRSCFTQKQLVEMEKHFERSHYITMEERIRLSEELNLNEAQIKIWFQNRRAKGKRMEDTKNTTNVIVKSERKNDDSLKEEVVV